MRVREFLFSVMIYTFCIFGMLVLLALAAYKDSLNWYVWWISFIVLFVGFLSSLPGLERTGRRLERLDREDMQEKVKPMQPWPPPPEKEKCECMNDLSFCPDSWRFHENHWRNKDLVTCPDCGTDILLGEKCDTCSRRSEAQAQGKGAYWDKVR